MKQLTCRFCKNVLDCGWLGTRTFSHRTCISQAKAEARELGVHVPKEESHRDYYYKEWT